MSAVEILKELPKLNLTELEAVCRCAVELQGNRALEASPELLAAMDAADESFRREGGVSVDEARRIVASWNTK